MIDTDSVGNSSIVMGSSDGTLVAVTPYEVLWKCLLSQVLKQGIYKLGSYDFLLFLTKTSRIAKIFGFIFYKKVCCVSSTSLS